MKETDSTNHNDKVAEYHDTSEMSKTGILKPKISFFSLVYNEGYKEY